MVQESLKILKLCNQHDYGGEVPIITKNPKIK